MQNDENLAVPTRYAFFEL